MTGTCTVTEEIRWDEREEVGALDEEKEQEKGCWEWPGGIDH